ncbi:MAG: nucleotide exchange factor GrpE [Bacteroidetes bacterium]|nr:nucleotide exchange factor GrpE [Bacteroidota bacterium]
MENNDNDTILNENSPETGNEHTDNKDENTENTSQQPLSEADVEAKIKELNDKYLRLYSEFDNYRKRTIKEKSDIIRSAGEDVFKALLPVIDDFERAIKANETITDAEAIKQGIHLIYNKMKSACTSKGLEPMESIGKSFDSDLMEAITHIPAPSEDMKGKVIDDVERGYKLGDKVIRFAKVVVGN